jgi:hypothetical protein
MIERCPFRRVASSGAASPRRRESFRRNWLNPEILFKSRDRDGCIFPVGVSLAGWRSNLAGGFSPSKSHGYLKKIRGGEENDEKIRFADGIGARSYAGNG